MLLRIELQEALIQRIKLLRATNQRRWGKGHLEGGDRRGALDLEDKFANGEGVAERRGFEHDPEGAVGQRAGGILAQQLEQSAVGGVRHCYSNNRCWCTPGVSVLAGADSPRAARSSRSRTPSVSAH